tara:strand:- start:5605 stop:6489 length:885 start_codon:yes stop_codon:yes gene_type:complete
MSKALTLKLHASATGYADKQLRPTLEEGISVDKPFVLFTGPNGSGKSACLRGIRSTIGLAGERFGSAGEVLGVEGTPYAPKASKDDQNPFFRHREEPSAVFDLEALGWNGQPCYLFDSRAASQMASKSSFDEDMFYHVSLIAGGGSKVSHGQFVTKTWNEAIEWACGAQIQPHGQGDWSADRKKIVDKITKGKPSEERWLFLDEPEGAIDIERLLIGLAAVLHVAEIGKLRVFCSSHSLLFAAGLVQHPKVQVIDLKSQQGTHWMDVQQRAMAFAADPDWLSKVGQDIAQKISG